MTRSTAASKILLLADRRAEPDTAGGATVRRYRLARLSFGPRNEEPGARFEHLKRTYD